MIALYIDNQWTVEWRTWLPYKTNQFHFFSVQSNFNYCRKVLSLKIIWITIKTKNVRQNLCCVGSLLQYITHKIIAWSDYFPHNAAFL